MGELKVNVLGQGNNRLELAKLKDILASAIVIPDYQRPYAWNEENIEELFETIKSNYDDNKKISFLGSIIFCQPSELQMPNQEKYFIIDGQQRLTSLLIVLRYIANKTKDSDITDLKNEYETATDFEKKMDIKDCLNKLENTGQKLIECIKKSKIDRGNAQNEDENHIIQYVSSGKLEHDSVKNIVDGISEGLNSIEIVEPDNVKKANFYCDIAEYILDKVQFCWLSIAGEDAENFAIDMFNTMNSTGEPLTGFEIFKSGIYKLDNSKNKDKHGKIEDIQKGITKFFNNDRKKIVKHTGKFILFLSLYRKDGYKDIRDASDKDFKKQKRCIEKILAKPNDIASVCADSKKIYEFYFETWLKHNNKHQHKYKKEVGFCFSFLSDIGHDIVLPILLHFSDNEINVAIKYCTAFSVLWRSFHRGGTAGVDGVYKKIAKALTENSSIDELHNQLIESLKGRSINKKKWLESVKDAPLYNNNKKLSRFLILVASNMLTYENGTLKATTGHNMLNKVTWSGEDENYKTIEHIVPQNEQTDESTLKSCHVLGNLTLLPQAFNSSLKNDPFLKKKAEFTRVCNKSTDDTLHYLPILKELINIDDFNQQVVDDRTENLGSIIWDKLAVEWLGFKE